MTSSLNFKKMFWSNLTYFEPFEGLLDNNVGDSLSITTATLLELFVAVTAVPAFPAKSLNEIPNVTGPAVSFETVVNEAAQLFPPVFETLILPFTAAPPDKNVTVGDWIVSLAVKLNVTTSLGVAVERSPLLEEMDTALKVGIEVSVVTLPLPLVTGVPTFPAVSLKLIL